VVRPADHTAIVPRALFNRAQKALQSRVKVPNLVRTPANLPAPEAHAPPSRVAVSGG